MSFDNTKSSVKEGEERGMGNGITKEERGSGAVGWMTHIKYVHVDEMRWSWLVLPL